MLEDQLRLLPETICQETRESARQLAKFLQENETGHSFTLEVNHQKFPATAYDCNGGMVIVTQGAIAIASLNPQTHKLDIQKYIPF